MLFVNAFWPSLIWALLIFILCIVPGNEMPEIGFWNFDKLAHTFSFGILISLILLGYKKQKRLQGNSLKPFLTGILVCILFGGCIELIQGLFIYKRSAELNDLLADTLGSVVFGWLFIQINKRYFS